MTEWHGQEFMNLEEFKEQYEADFREKMKDPDFAKKYGPYPHTYAAWDGYQESKELLINNNISRIIDELDKALEG